MSNDIDLLPVYDAITKSGSGQLSDIWVGAFSYLIQNLQQYLTQGGLILPQLTTAQRDALSSVINQGGNQGVQNGQMIYNTTLGTAQYFKAGAWVSF